MIQPGEDPNFFVDFIHLMSFVCLDGLACHLTVIHSIKCEMDCSEASAPEAM